MFGRSALSLRKGGRSRLPFDLVESLVRDGCRNRDLVMENTYSELKVDHLVCHRRHLIVKAGPIVTDVVCCKDEVALTFLGALHYHTVIGTDYLVVDIEGATRLNLSRSIS